MAGSSARHEPLNAYWTGIAQILPEPFDPANNPKDYAIQKGQGTIALHRVVNGAHYWLSASSGHRGCTRQGSSSVGNRRRLTERTGCRDRLLMSAL